MDEGRKIKQKMVNILYPVLDRFFTFKLLFIGSILEGLMRKLFCITFGQTGVRIQSFLHESNQISVFLLNRN